MRWGPLTSLSVWCLAASACGQESCDSEQDVFITRWQLHSPWGNAPIPPAEATTLFREALTMLRALQCKQGVLVALSAARNACIDCCSSAKHNPSWGQEPQLTSPLLLMSALSISLQSCSFFVSLYSCFLSFWLILVWSRTFKRRGEGCSSRISGCLENRTHGFEFSQVEKGTECKSPAFSARAVGKVQI